MNIWHGPEGGGRILERSQSRIKAFLGSYPPNHQQKGSEGAWSEELLDSAGEGSPGLCKGCRSKVGFRLRAACLGSCDQRHLPRTSPVSRGAPAASDGPPTLPGAGPAAPVLGAPLPSATLAGHVCRRPVTCKQHLGNVHLLG